VSVASFRLSHDRIAENRLIIPIQNIYPVEQVRTAYEELARRYARGRIVLEFDAAS
jgi:D-arabinose 1-dehydrogenase-like Zn-dependent alcohol dehydrogenase